MKDISEALLSTLSHIADVACRCGRDPQSVRLVAVSKTHPAASVVAAASSGQRIFGESRVQEAREKIPLCPPDLDWHFIGHLQKNKVRQALPLFSVFHSIDSLSLASAIDRVAAESGRVVRGLLEVNISGESTKYGFSPDQLRTDFPTLAGFNNLQIIGLMTMAPYSENPEEARPVFASLRLLRDELEQRYHAALPELSMGMSGDLDPAIEEGATLVRVGSSIFGHRPTPES